MQLSWRALLPALLLWSFSSFSQSLQPGFDAGEYAHALAVNFGKEDSIANSRGVAPAYKRIYRSAVTGLDNRWDLWMHASGKQAVISIRGTVATASSWTANAFSAMLPATGTLKYNDTTSFTYKLAGDNAAAVHSGWLLSLGSLAPDIERKIRELHTNGVRNILITGHSQGGAIAYLLRSLIHYRTEAGALPAGITYKTYCSAAPKPGNLQYVYDYDFITRNGWGFNVVNAADWVPETPVSIQQLSDFNRLNPFLDVRTALKGQKWYLRMYAGMVHRRLNRATRKSAARYEHYFGDKLGRQVRKKWPQLQLPRFSPSMNYMRAGTPVVLMPDAAYYTRFPSDPKQKGGIFSHHLFDAYYGLTQAIYGQQIL